MQRAYNCACVYNTTGGLPHSLARISLARLKSLAQITLQPKPQIPAVGNFEMAALASSAAVTFFVAPIRVEIFIIILTSSFFSVRRKIFVYFCL